MREHGPCDRLDVVGEHEVAAVRERARLRDPQERDPGARARSEREPRAAAGVPEQRDDVAVEALLDEERTGLVDRGGDSASVATGTSESSGGSVVCSFSIRASSASCG